MPMPMQTQMDEDTLAALRASIEHWQWVVAIAEPIGRSNCALCDVFRGRDTLEDCAGCPVRAVTGLKYCEGTPYGEYENYLDYDPPVEDEKRIVLAQAELDFLRSLLPQEG